MRYVAVFLIIATIAAAAWGQAHDLTALNNNEAGKRIIAYFDAFNSDDEQKLRAYFSDNISADALKQRPIEPRLAFHKQVKADFGKLEITKVDAVRDDEIALIARGANGGSVSYSFKLATDKKIQSM